MKAVFDREDCWRSVRCKMIVFMTMLSLVLHAAAQKKSSPPPAPIFVAKGQLQYTPDSLGNRIPDFSYCGYKASTVVIPLVPVKVFVPVKTGDATRRIQAALDHVASLPLDQDGFRGVVLLGKGNYEVSGQLKINANGVILRGSGMSDKGTIITGTGLRRDALVWINGKNDRVTEKKQTTSNAYVPVNATQFPVADGEHLKKGDHIIIRRPSTQAWITALGTTSFGGGISALGWKPGDRDILFDRLITNVNGNELTIDAPITTALDPVFGGGTVTPYTWLGRIENVGIENLQLRSTFNKANLKDEDHRWNAISLENAQDAWVRQVRFENFAGSAVSILESAKRVTVEDCISLNPVSEIGGQRRYTYFTGGQQTLFQRCYAERGYHDFATGYCAAGPNAFVQCESSLPFSFSGAIDSWASGVLFDIVNVDGNAIRFGNRGQDGNGAGWTAANSVVWNCTAARIDCYKPPTAQNWSFGSWSEFSGDGYWGESNNTIEPRSLFYAQLATRLNQNVDERARLSYVPGEASSSPSVEVAQQLTKEAIKPRQPFKEWVAMADKRDPIPSTNSNVPPIDAIGIPTPVRKAVAPQMQVKNGWIVRGGEILTGKRQSVPWWTGGVQGKELEKAQPAITRYVPGRTGKGLTDDLEVVTQQMKENGIIGMEQNYGLWYDRRRDDHERIRRMDGEVWPPFYELPFARSGKDTAWDGLSKYDLTKYNPFYWARLKDFANLADQQGLLLINQQYFQHNIIEAGAHYADFPWRTANNINATGFPEPPPYAGDKRIFMAEQFYDITNAKRKALHRAYIRKSLENFQGNSGVLQLIGEEYTGPLHFVEFWLDVTRAWEKETGHHPLIGLSTTKDVQDAILQNPTNAATIDVIDIRYWHYQADGTAYAPEGGKNLAPRQHARLLKPKKTSFEQVYRAVKEYRVKYPDKAVVYSGDNSPAYGWAALMGGGSLPVVPRLPKAFLQAASGMMPLDQQANKFVLANETGFIIYEPSVVAVNNFDANDTYSLQWIDADRGEFIGAPQEVKAAALKDLLFVQRTGLVVWGTKIKRK
ncbi:MAG: DUF6298 domain-containing protein [Ferruginibacter sp.]|nr:DUF6298 domain-containing protein [Ferruginibacter sp.]